MVGEASFSIAAPAPVATPAGTGAALQTPFCKANSVPLESRCRRSAPRLHCVLSRPTAIFVSEVQDDNTVVASRRGRRHWGLRPHGCGRRLGPVARAAA